MAPLELVLVLGVVLGHILVVGVEARTNAPSAFAEYDYESVSESEPEDENASDDEQEGPPGRSEPLRAHRQRRWLREE